jgi:hypothetical protein
MPTALEPALPQEGDVRPLPVRAARGFHDHRRVGGPDHRHHQLRVDRSAVEVVVPVAAGAEAVLGVVRVHQVDLAGDGLDPVHQVEQLLTARVRVAGVQAEPDAVTADRVPEPGQCVQPAGARVVAASGVLDQDRDGEAARLGGVGERLAPVVEADGQVVAGVDVTAVHDQPLGADRGGGLRVAHQQFPARDADSVVERGDVDDVRGVDVDVHLGGAKTFGVLPRPGAFTPCGSEEELSFGGAGTPPRAGQPSRRGPVRMQASLRRGAVGRGDRRGGVVVPDSVRVTGRAGRR